MELRAPNFQQKDAKCAEHALLRSLAAPLRVWTSPWAGEASPKGRASFGFARCAYRRGGPWPAIAGIVTTEVLTADNADCADGFLIRVIRVISGSKAAEEENINLRIVLPSNDFAGSILSALCG